MPEEDRQRRELLAVSGIETRSVNGIWKREQMGDRRSFDCSCLVEEDSHLLLERGAVCLGGLQGILDFLETDLLVGFDRVVQGQLLAVLLNDLAAIPNLVKA